MNKEELIRAVSQETGRIISQDKISLLLNKAVEIVEHTLTSGEPVKWKGFGTLIVKESTPKRIYSPFIKSYVGTKEKKIVFRESKKKKDT